MSVNAWMNAPTGFTFSDGRFQDIDPVAAMFNPAWGVMTVHMLLASFVAVGFGVAGVHAWMLRRQPGSRFHRAALGLGLSLAAPGAILQVVSGDILTRHVAEHQPVKFAALEGHFRTEPRAPLRLGGLPDAETRTVPGAIEIPGALSFLAHRDVNAPVTGLEEFPPEDWPPLKPVRFAWQLMIAVGTWLAAIGALALWRRRRGPAAFDAPWFLALLAGSAPLGFVAIEAGWVVTEVGRQPWIVYRFLRTAEAVTPMPGLAVPLTAFTVLYLVLAGVVTLLMWRMIRSTAH
jgi:cytochrome d ubiquinol oxidase subunit I